ncbi:MAG: hypothetical protein IT304_10765 [Dehalococcoidia bacterium]|nr:hypothetical protein [Dehalococcoidia bacterium]
MADLQETAEQFARDLVGQNLAGLMMSFTAEGMYRAMELQAQRQAAGPQPPSTGFEVNFKGADGEDQVVDIVVKSAEAEGTIVTRWRDVAGSWKVNDMAMKD